MNSYLVDEYLRRKAESKRELDTWAKISWGIFIGAIVMAMALGKWSTTNNFGEEISLSGARLATPFAIVLLVAYQWRKKAMNKRLTSLWQEMSIEERNKLDEIESKNRNIS